MIISLLIIINYVRLLILYLLIIAIPINFRGCKLHLSWKVMCFQQLKVVSFYFKVVFFNFKRTVYIKTMWPFILKSCDSSYKYYFNKNNL